MNKDYLIYLDNVFMEEAKTLKQAIAEAKNYIRTQQGKLAEVVLLEAHTDILVDVYRVANNCHVEDYSVEVLA